MKLTLDGISSKEQWLEKGIRLPEFDIEKVRVETEKTPEWVHFGAGNIFRGFIGSIAQSLLNSGDMKTGIIAVESFDFDIIDKIYVPYDELTLNVVMSKDKVDAEVLAGIAAGIKTSDYDRLYTIAKSPSLKLISFTITEKGYAVKMPDGSFIGIVENDIENGPDKPKHTMSIIGAMLYRRYKENAAPIAIVSMDNCSHNGEKLKAGITAVIRAWEAAGKVEPQFMEYIESKVSFPWSMIDKITPRPNDIIRSMLEAKGVEDMEPTVTGKGTYIAPFVNAEAAQYLVIEDDFPNGRPPLENAGVFMTTRQTVNKAETMKVTTCLNPLHTGLAIFGCLLGYKTIWEEMNDPELRGLVNRLADEGMKVVTDPEIIDPDKFVYEVINERLPNPYMPDAPQRIATDTSQKLPVRYGETVKAYIADSRLDASSLCAVPMVIAGWFRYLLAIDDNGDGFIPSADPMLERMQAELASVKFGKPETGIGVLKEILKNETLFGTDLCRAGLYEKIEAGFMSMLSGKGAVRKALKEM